MVWTTPLNKAHLHKSWHKFAKGLCLYCGYYCTDCPQDVATCKCKTKINLGMISQGELDEDSG